MRRPSDAAEHGACPVADAQIVDRAVASVRRAQAAGWGAASPRDRTRALGAWADLIKARAPELARLETLSSTRPGQLVARGIAVIAEQIASLPSWPTTRGRSRPGSHRSP